MASGFAKWGNDLYTGRRSYDIIGKRKRWYLVGLLLIGLSLLAILGKGLALGIDFKGGTEFEISNVANTSQAPAQQAMASVVPELAPRIANVGSNGIRVQSEALTSDQVIEARQALADAYEVPVEDVSPTTIGPAWGQDVSKKALQGTIIFLILVMIVMSLYFRAWRMAAAALLALFHDLIVTVGIYALVGWEITPATVIGFLTILGYSVYDTVVVFDKVKENTENITDQSVSTYAEQANLAVNQTLVRSINTSVVALLPVGSILFIGAFILGAGTLRDIALALFVGMGVGTFSSIFLATPLEVELRRTESKIAEHTAKVEAKRLAAAKPGPDGEPVVATVAAGRQLQPGFHRGNAAQPRRKRK